MRRRISQFNRNDSFTIQIAPLIDVVLVLLIIFMITAPAFIGGFEVKLPNGNESVSDADLLSPIVISLSKDEIIYINDDISSMQNLLKDIKSRLGENYDKTIFIKGDRLIKYGDIMSLIDMLNVSGYKKTVLVTEYNQ